MPTTDVLRSRYRGCLLGVAAGNALGLGLEGWAAAAIARRFPHGVSEVAPAERHRPWDDDLAQTALLAEALLDGPLDLDDLARRLTEWGRRNGRGMGLLTRRVLAALEAGAGAGDAARRVFESAPTGSAGNGAVMRCAPIALRWRRDRARMWAEARTGALVTHYDPRCVWSTIAVVDLVAAALEGAEPNVEDLARRIGEAGAPPETSEALRDAAGAGLADLRLDGWDSGYTLKAMQVAVWSARQAGLEAALTAVVAAGGDTDTNAAIAGAVLGARHGEEAVPRRWLDNIANVEALVLLADRLREASGAG